MFPAAPDDRGPAAPSPPPPRPAPIIPDHEFLRCIGRGAYGEVWLARNVLGAFRAVKLVYRDAFPDRRPYDREFDGLKEFEPLSRAHEGLVDVLQIGISERSACFYYVMELADDAASDAPLAAAVKSAAAAANQDQHHDGSSVAYSPKTLASELAWHGRLPFTDCLQLGLALASALDFLHRHQLIHRDIKPSNIIFVNGTPKLADIGLVARTDETLSFMGTPGYIAPEGQISPQSDVFSLGKVLYELGTGKDRQRFPEPLTALADQPDHGDWLEFNEVVERACANDPRQRHASAADLRAELALLLGGKSVRRLRRLERLTKRAGYAAAVLVLLLAVGGIIAKSRLDIAKDRQWQLLIQEMELTRLASRDTNWSGKLWEDARRAAAFRKDGTLQAHAAASLAGLDAQLLTKVTDFSASAVAFDPSDLTGRRLLIGGSLTNPAAFWDTDTRQLRTAGPNGPGPVTFAPDGTSFRLVLTTPLEAELWDVAANTSKRTLRSSALGNLAPTVKTPEPVLALSANATLAAATTALASNHHRFVVWRTATGEVLRQFSQRATALAFSSDDTLLASGDEAGLVTVWDLEPALRSNVPLAVLRTSPTNQITSLAFRRDIVTGPAGNVSKPNWLLAAGDAGGRVTLYDLGTRSIRRLFEAPSYGVSALAFNADGTLLATGGHGGKAVRLWDVANGQLLMEIDGGYVTGLTFSPDGMKLAASNREWFGSGGVRVWELDRGRGIQCLRGLTTQVHLICFSPDDRLVAAQVHNWQVGVWERASGKLLHVFDAPRGNSADNFALRFSPDGRRLACATARGARLWEVAGGREINSWAIPAGVQETLAFDPAGRLLLAHAETADDTDWPLIRLDPQQHPRVCRVRDLFSTNFPQTLTTITNFSERVVTAALTPDGRRLIVSRVGFENRQCKTQIMAFDPLSGAVKWAFPTYMGPAGLDPSGLYASFEIGQKEFGLVEMSSRNVVQKYFTNGVLGPGARLRSVSGNVFGRSRGFGVVGQDETRPLVTLGIDPMDGFPAIRFSHDGRHVAWGTIHGTVFVADLEAVNRRLKGLDLEW